MPYILQEIPLYLCAYHIQPMSQNAHATNNWVTQILIVRYVALAVVFCTIWCFNSDTNFSI